MPTLTQVTLHHTAPAHILRIAHCGAVAHTRWIIAPAEITPGIIAVGIAVAKAQNVFHLELPIP